jgi:hypothetical protein
MAKLIEPMPRATSLIEAIQTFYAAFPTSLSFIIGKVSGALFWNPGTPYMKEFTNEVNPVAVLVTSLVGIGLVGVVSFFVASIKTSSFDRLLSTILLGVAILGVVTLVFTPSESRYAAPLIVVSIVGVLLVLLNQGKVRVFVLIGGIALGIFLLSTGYISLQDPAPPGAPSLELCANLRS